MRKVVVKAPINIALIKYWGKRDVDLVLPYTDSISLSLDIFHTTTTISDQKEVLSTFEINGQKDEKTAQKSFYLIEQMIGKHPQNIHIDTYNSGPTAAGLASSASGFAALVVAVNRYYQLNLEEDKLQYYTRIGSGSAIRSLKGGCVMWKKDGLIESIPFPFDDILMAIYIVDGEKKSIGSTEGMQRSIETSPLYHAWVEQSAIDKIAFIDALQQRNFNLMGEISEHNALGMHRVCETSYPPIQYLNNVSYNLIRKIQEARTHGIHVYATADAGPNIKVILRKNQKDLFLKFMEKHTHLKPIFSGISLTGAEVIDETF